MDKQDAMIIILCLALLGVTTSTQEYRFLYDNISLYGNKLK